MLKIYLIKIFRRKKDKTLKKEMNYVLTVQQIQTKNRLMDIKKNGNAHRYGALFTTNRNVYFYDAGTQKAVVLDDKSFCILEKFFNPQIQFDDFKNAFTVFSSEEERAFLDCVTMENLIALPEVKELRLSLNEDIEALTKAKLQQLILEVTESCNFRCKYCIYNEDYAGDRNFGQALMSYETAKKSVDYAFEHGEERLAITFYGGEPLINFELIAQTVQYALEKNQKAKKQLSFNMTSNMSLMTPEIANFIASTPAFEFIASVDGPQFVHDKARVYAGGKGSFVDVEKGLKYLCEALKRVGRTDLGINAVFISPYTYEKLDEINEYFRNLEFLPEGTFVQITYASPDSFDDSAFWKIAANNPKYQFRGFANPLVKWQLEQFHKNGIDLTNQKNIYSKNMVDRLARIDGRFILDTPNDNFHCNGNCVPGMRKLYVKADGTLTACERIGSSPSFGKIDEGINYSALKRYYVDEYIEKSLAECNECWAINMCPVCYALCYDENGINLEQKHACCNDARANLIRDFGLYYTLQEETPEKLKFLAGVGSL